MGTDAAALVLIRRGQGYGAGVTTPELEYDFQFDPWFRRVAAPLGIRPDSTRLTIDDERLDVRFGRWHVRTPIGNVRDAKVTGPYAWPKVIGPPHISFADGGLTMATNREAGVCIRFWRPVTGISPLAFPRHGSLTVTVEDPATLAAALTAVAAADDDEPVEEVTEELELDLTGATASELRARAESLGIAGTSRMRKAELVELLRPRPVTDDRS